MCVRVCVVACLALCAKRQKDTTRFSNPNAHTQTYRIVRRCFQCRPDGHIKLFPVRGGVKCGDRSLKSTESHKSRAHHSQLIRNKRCTHTTAPGSSRSLRQLRHRFRLSVFFCCCCCCCFSVLFSALDSFCSFTLSHLLFLFEANRLQGNIYESHTFGIGCHCCRFCIGCGAATTQPTIET